MLVIQSGGGGNTANGAQTDLPNTFTKTQTLDPDTGPALNFPNGFIRNTGDAQVASLFTAGNLQANVGHFVGDPDIPPVEIAVGLTDDAGMISSPPLAHAGALYVTSDDHLWFYSTAWHRVSLI